MAAGHSLDIVQRSIRTHRRSRPDASGRARTHRAAVTDSGSDRLLQLYLDQRAGLDERIELILTPPVTGDALE